MLLSIALPTELALALGRYRLLYFLMAVDLIALSLLITMRLNRSADRNHLLLSVFNPRKATHFVKSEIWTS